MVVDSLPEPESEKEKTFHKIINWIITTKPAKIQKYVDKLRDQNKGISNDALARKIVKRKSFRNGLVGAITGVPGFPLLPVTVPADLAFSWKIQATMACAVAYVYDHTHETTDLKTDIYLILATDSAKEALKSVGIETAKGATKKVVEKYVTREMMKKIWKIVGQKVITKAGQKSLTSFVKWVPLVGAPVGFTFDWITARIIGRFAIKYYKG